MVDPVTQSNISDVTTTLIKVCASNERMFLAMSIAVSIATIVGVFVGTYACKRLRCKKK